MTITWNRSRAFLTDQIVKTRRNPTRVPIILSNYGSAILRRGFDKPLQKLSFAKSRFRVRSRQTTPPPVPDIASQLEEDLDPLAVFQSGISALNEVRIADAVRLLTRAATIDSGKSGAENLWMRREAYRNLGLALHHGLGRLDEAICCWRESGRLSRLIAENYDVPELQGVEVFDQFWSNHIGHTAILGIMIKRDLVAGQINKKRYLIRTDEHNIGNRYLVEQMGRFFTLVDDPTKFAFPREYAAAFCKLFWIDNRANGPATHPWQVLAEISRAWEQKGLGPLLAFSNDELELGRSRRTAIGVPANAWHVCLHVRDSGFKHFHDDLHGTLNGDIRTYDLAIAAVVRRGGWVVRMGDVSMPGLPSTKNVIDYAHSPQKSPEMDIFLSGTCRFFIGTSSGPALVPALYGVPSVITNWFPTGTRPLNSGDIFIPKLHWYENDDEFAPFDESMSQPLGHIHALPVLAELGVSLRPNLREELGDLVEEMLDRLDGGTEYTAEDQQLQSYFEKVALQSRSYGNARIGRDFLRKYRGLLPPALVN
jgi:putative glycosyltransferase (TIGR04372 family)